MFLYDDEGNLLKHKVGSFQLPNHKNRTEKLKRSDDYPLVKMYKFLTTGEAHNPAEFFNPSVNWMREIVQQGDKIDPGKLSVEARVTYDELLRQVAEHQSIQKPVNENYYQKKKSVVEHVYKVQSQILKENPGKKTRSSIFLTLDDVDKIYADFLAQQAVKRPAGRPRKARTPEELAAMAAKVKLSVGRPRKERTPEELAATAAAKQQKAELIAQRRAVREARAMAPKRPVGRPKTIQTPEQKAAKAAAIAAYQANYRARRRAKKHAAEGAQAKFKGN